MADQEMPPDDEVVRINMADFGRTLAARRAELGNPEMPRNSGARRTPSKRALLKAIEEAGGTW